MREHIGLYRGKRIDNGEWVEGAFIPESCEIVVMESDGGTSYDQYSYWYYRVDPDTVGECTGLRDKNGKLIFEGDICKVGKLIYKVEFKYSSWWFTILSDKVYCCPAFNSHCGEHCEIISTIYDNPELLKGGEGDG